MPTELRVHPCLRGVIGPGPPGVGARRLAMYGTVAFNDTGCGHIAYLIPDRTAMKGRGAILGVF